MEIRELISLWEAGEANPSQEAEIRAYFRSESRIPENLRAYSVLFAGLSEMGKETMGAELKLKSKKSKMRRWSLSLSFAVMAIVLSLYYGSEPYCYVNGKAVRNVEEALAAATPLQNLSTLGDSFDYVLDLLKQNR